MTQTLEVHNAPHLRALAERLRANGVAALVGAGTSIACGYPGWDQFLSDVESALAERLQPAELTALRARDFRTRVDVMARQLGRDFSRLFHKTFEPHTPPRTAAWIQMLFDLPLALLLTTNYTSELEDAARLHGRSPLQPPTSFVRWHRAAEMANVLRRMGGAIQIVYLHGRYDDSPEIDQDGEGREWSRVVLGEKSYQYAYVFPGALRHRCHAVCQIYTLLVIGASLRDEDVTGTLRFVKALSGPEAPPHYVIWPIETGDPLRDAAADLIDRFGLHPIFYEMKRTPEGASDHSGVEKILVDLRRRAGSNIVRFARAWAAASEKARVDISHHLMRGLFPNEIDDLSEALAELGVLPIISDATDVQRFQIQWCSLLAELVFAEREVALAELLARYALSVATAIGHGAGERMARELLVRLSGRR